MNSVCRTITFILIFLANNCFAQKVTNITAEQVGQTIQVSYNLEAESPCTISLFYSTDNGSTWQGPLKKVSGDVGEKISSVNKKITWDVLNEMDQLKFSSVVFKVDARKPGLKEVKIGNQIWSAENLNLELFANGELIPEANSNEAWLEAGENQKAAWCYYDNDSTNGPVYGKLYNWYAVADPRALCPNSWHVPEDWEWNVLVKTIDPIADTTCNNCFQSQIAGGAMKEIGLTHWASPNTGASNSSGFSGFLGGFRNYKGAYFDVGSFGYWWSATQSSTTSAYDRNLFYFSSDVGRSSSSKLFGFPVRCVRD